MAVPNTVQYDPGADPANQVNVSAPSAPSAPGGGVVNPYQLSNAQIYGPVAANLAGAGLSAYGQYQQNQQNLAQNALQFASNQTQNQYNTEQAQKASNASGVLNADPLGADQRFSQHNALMSSILPGLNIGASSPGGTGRMSAMEGVTKFDPAMVNAQFGPDATMASIAQRHAELNNLDANAPTPNLTNAYGSQGNAPAVQAQMQGYQQQLQSLNATQKAAFQSKLDSYTQQMVAQENQQGDTGGFWHTFAKIAGVVGSIAAIALTGGGAAAVLGPVMGGLLGAGSAAVGALGAGQSGGSALGSAIIGAAGPAIKGLVTK